jgi:hypothetical protein
MRIQAHIGDWLIRYSQHAQDSGQPAERCAQPYQLAATPYDAKVTTPIVMSMSSGSTNLGQLVKQTAKQQQPLLPLQRCMPGCKCQPAPGNTVFATQDSCAWQLHACTACMHGLHACCGTSLGHDLDWHTHLLLRKCRHGSTHTQQQRQQQRHMLSVTQ